MTSVPVRGTNIHPLGREEAVDAVVDLVHAGDGGAVYLVNVHLVEEARKNRALRKALASADLVLPDGAPVAWWIRRSGSESARVTGSRLFAAVCERTSGSPTRHFLLGATPAVLSRMRTSIEARFPDARVTGSFAPPFAHAHEQDVRMIGETVAAAGADLVWVGMGAPKQELLIARLRTELPETVFVGVGAVFDFVAGTKRRAPKPVRRLGCEWLYRLLQEPRRLGPRYLTTNTSFIFGAVRTFGIAPLVARGSGAERA